MSRIRHASDLTYHLQQAVRHAVMLEAFLTHGNDTADVIAMLCSDMNEAASSLLAYRNNAMKRDDNETT